MPIRAARLAFRCWLTIVLTAITWSGSVACRIPRKNPITMMESNPIIRFSLLQLFHFHECQAVRRQRHRQLAVFQIASFRSRKLGRLLQLLNLRLSWIRRRTHLLIGGMHISMAGVDCENQSVLVVSSLKPQSYVLRGTALFRRRIVPDCNN